MIVMEGAEDAEDVKNLMQSCPPMTLQVSCLEIHVVGTEDWRVLAEGLQSHPVVEEAYISKESLDSVRKEDLRFLWDAVTPDGLLNVFTEGEGGRRHYEKFPYEKEDGEAAWIRLCQIKDLSKGG